MGGVFNREDDGHVVDGGVHLVGMRDYRDLNGRPNASGGLADVTAGCEAAEFEMAETA